MEPEKYEKLVRTIAESIARSADDLPEEAIKDGRKNLWPGASGFEHQIDVSVHGHKSVLLVECKHWTKTISVEPILTLQGRLDDIRPMWGAFPVDAAIITSCDFTPNARRLASYFGIHCDLIKSFDEWAFKYAKTLWIRPLSASAKVAAGIGKVTVDDTDKR